MVDQYRISGDENGLDLGSAFRIARRIPFLAFLVLMILDGTRVEKCRQIKPIAGQPITAIVIAIVVAAFRFVVARIKIVDVTNWWTEIVHKGTTNNERRIHGDFKGDFCGGASHR